MLLNWTKKTRSKFLNSCCKKSVSKKNNFFHNSHSCSEAHPNGTHSPGGKRPWPVVLSPPSTTEAKKTSYFHFPLSTSLCCDYLSRWTITSLFLLTGQLMSSLYYCGTYIRLLYVSQFFSTNHWPHGAQSRLNRSFTHRNALTGRLLISERNSWVPTQNS